MLTGLSPFFRFFFSFFLIFLIFIRTSTKEGKGKGVPLQRVTPLMTSQRLVNLFEYKSHFGTNSRLVETVKAGFHMIVTIVAIAENGCDDPDDHMETPSSIVRQNEKFAMFPQEAESKYKNIITGYGVNNTSKEKNLFLDAALGQREFANWSGFLFS